MAAYEVIARKYRPTAFDEVVGQEAVARTLRNAIRGGRIAHAYMFCGPRGVGKTSTARILARALNCLERDAPSEEPCGTCDLCRRVTAGEDHDVLEIDAASNRKVDDARNLIANVSFHPSRTRFKVYIVDEVHMLTTEAFNALLKTLEEPPAHVKFIFATTDPQKVPATILSRCQRFDFRPVPPEGIARILRGICESESLDAEPEALLAIARAAVGGVRDAQSLLEQLATLGSGRIRVEDLHGLLGTVPGGRMAALFDALAEGRIGDVLDAAAAEMDRGTDPGELLRQCMRHAHDLMTIRSRGADAPGLALDAETRRRLSEQAGRFSHATLVYAVSLFADTIQRTRHLGEGRILTETALARLAGHRELRYVDQLVRELRRLEKTPADATTVQLSDELREDGGQGGSRVVPTTVTAPVERRAPSEPVVVPPPERTPAAPPAVEPVAAREPEPVRASALAPAHQAEVVEPAVAPMSVEAGPAEAAETHTAPEPASQAPAPHESVPEPDPTVREAESLAAVVAPAETGEPQASDASDWTAPAPTTGDGAEPADVEELTPWDRVQAALRGNSRLRAALAAAAVESVGDDALVLSFPKDAAWQVRAVLEGEGRTVVLDAVADAYGRRLRLEAVEREESNKEEEAQETGEARRDLYRVKLTRAQMQEAREAPLTRLVERLGGEVLRLESDL